MECNECKIQKELSEFYLKHGKYDCICKVCRRIKVKQYKKKNKEYLREYNKEYREKNKDHISDYKKDYYDTNIESII